MAHLSANYLSLLVSLICHPPTQALIYGFSSIKMMTRDQWELHQTICSRLQYMDTEFSCWHGALDKYREKTKW